MGHVAPAQPSEKLSEILRSSFKGGTWRRASRGRFLKLQTSKHVGPAQADAPQLMLSNKEPCTEHAASAHAHLDASLTTAQSEAPAMQPAMEWVSWHICWGCGPPS